MVYQEQVMQIVHGLGDIPLREAYTLIKAISKKKHDTINAMRPRFLEGAQHKGLAASRADELFDLILKFAGYGFNKSHSTCYSIIAYQTAHLKTYFPNQYMAALLTYESAARKVEDWAPYLEDCRNTRFPDHTDARPHVGVEVRPPDINLSDASFSVVFVEDEPRDAVHGHVRFGLSAIKGAGKAAVNAVIEERRTNGPFASIFDFCERVPPRIVNKAAIEALIKAGAFDSVHEAKKRAAVFAAVDDAIAAGQSAADDRRNGQLNFFAELTAGSPEPTAPAAQPERPLPNVAPWDDITTLQHEKDVLGFHISGHPLDRHEASLRAYRTHTLAQAASLQHDHPVALGAMLTRIRHTNVRTGRSAGERMAMISLMDKTGALEGVVFSDAFRTCAHVLQSDAVLLFTGRMDTRRGEAQIIVEQAIRPEDAPRFLARAVEIEFFDDPEADPLPPLMSMVSGVLQQASAARGDGGRPAEVFIHVLSDNRRITLRPSRLRTVVAEPALLAHLRDLVGESRVRIIAGQPPVAPRVNGSGAYAPRREPAGV
jgi:DNA polymerase III subunit alpha